MSQWDLDILYLVYYNIFYLSGVDALCKTKRSRQQLFCNPLSHKFQNSVCGNMGQSCGYSVEYYFNQETHNTNNPPMNDLPSSSRFIQKHYNDMVGCD